MGNKVIRIILIIVLVFLAIPAVLGILSGVFSQLFGERYQEKKKEEVMTSVQYVTEARVEGYSFSFMLPEDYVQKDHATFDAFYTNEDSNFGVYGYHSENLAVGQTTDALYKEQNQYVLEGRASVSRLSMPEKKDINGLNITKTVYMGEKDGSINKYYFYLVEFKENPEVFAYVMMNSLSEYGDMHEEIFDNIVATAKLSEETYICLDNDVIVDDYDMQFTLGHNFKSEKHAAFDAYYSDGSAWFGVFGYDADDIAVDTDRQQLFKEQNESNVMHKEGAKQISEAKQYETGNLNITKEVYSSLEDGSEVYYLCYLVEFDEEPEKFAHVMIFVMPQYATANEKYFDEMVASGKIVAGDTGIE